MVQRMVATAVVAGHGGWGVAATVAVGGLSPRLLPSGPVPLLTVTRNRPSSSPLAAATAIMASRSTSASGTVTPKCSAE